MKPFISRVFFYNRAPFDRIDLSFEKNGISVLTGINGKGKTTVLSYIVDSWYELARHYYANEFKGNENTYFRVGTSIYVPDRTRPSIVYIRYIVDGQNVDYLNIEAGATRNQYDELVPFSNKIPFSSVDQKEGKSKRGRYVSSNINEELITSGNTATMPGSGHTVGGKRNYLFKFSCRYAGNGATLRTER